jgi:hypothetical protein
LGTLIAPIWDDESEHFTRGIGRLETLFERTLMRRNKHYYVSYIVTALMMLCLGAMIAPLGGCGTTQPVNTGQQAGQPNGRNANTQGNYIEQMTINITLPANATSAIPLTIVGAPTVTPGENNRQDITSQPANTGGSEGGAVASGNSVPFGVGAQPNVSGGQVTNTPNNASGGSPITQPATPSTSTQTTTPPASGGG